MEQWVAHMDRLKIKNLAYGLLVIQGKESDRTSFTVRRQKGKRYGVAEAEWLRGLETVWADPSNVERVFESRPMASPDIELLVVHTKRDGELAPSKFTLKTAYPFTVEFECQPWVATLAAQCNGKTSASEHFETGKRNEWIPGNVPKAQFAGTIGELVSRGILEIEGFEPPRQTSGHPELPTGL